MIKAIVISKLTGRKMERFFTPMDLLETYEDKLVEEVTMCDCSPVGETNVIECNCDEEWYEYELELIQFKEE